MDAFLGMDSSPLLPHSILLGPSRIRLRMLPLCLKCWPDMIRMTTQLQAAPYPTIGGLLKSRMQIFELEFRRNILEMDSMMKFEIKLKISCLILNSPEPNLCLSICRI